MGCANRVKCREEEWKEKHETGDEGVRFSSPAHDLERIAVFDLAKNGTKRAARRIRDLRLQVF